MNRIYDIWLSLVFGAGSKKLNSIVTVYSGAKQFYEAYRNGCELPSFITEKNLLKLESVTLDDAKKVFEECKKTGISVLTAEDEAFPKRLLKYSDCPYLLYVKGDITVCDGPSVAVVGTRKPGEYGENCAKYISRELALGGVTVISGGAVGIDSIAHSSALNEGGNTVCVLGGGINCGYLEKNNSLRENIAQSGAVVSEHPPSFKPTKYSFVTRNRIISALSDGVLVIEAGENSGALTTAKLANKQSVPVLSVAGAMFSESFKGSNELIKNGAFAVFSADDVFSALKLKRQPLTKKEKIHIELKEEHSKQFLFEKPEPSIPLTKDALILYRAFEKQEMTLSELSDRVDLLPPGLLVALSELEINGIITSVGGRKYRFL